jgi:hypothetical protein
MIDIIDTFGNRRGIELICLEKEEFEIKKIEMPT